MSSRDGKLTGMVTELEVLGLVSRRLEARGLSFMLTGSFALAFYATPRMTRDLDLVVALTETDVDGLVSALEPEFFVDADMAREAIQSERMFNLLHFASGIKVDLIIRKADPFRLLEFSRRQPASMGDVSTWIVSREDLILSKLVWARDTGSEQQRRDIRQLLSGPVDLDYLHRWATELDVHGLLDDLKS